MPRQPSLLRYLLSREEGWFAVWSISLALAGMLPFLDQMRNAHLLTVEGEQAFANVLRLEIDRSEGTTHYAVDFAFPVGDVWIEKSLRVSDVFYVTLQDEDRIAVRYWRKDPNLVRIEADPDLPLHILFLICGSFSFFCLLSAYLVLRRPIHIYWLSRHGIPIQAAVTKVEEGKGDGFQAVWIEPDGRTGKTSESPADKLPPIGRLITVLTDPSGKCPGVWEGDI